MLSHPCDDDLPGEIYAVISMWFELGGAWRKRRSERYANLLRRLPRGLRLVHTLIALDSEISNGGFWQFFGNSDGQFSKETLADCGLVGATRRAELLSRAIALWRPAQKRFDAASGNEKKEQQAWHNFDSKVEPKLDELGSAYYAFEESEPIYGLIMAFLRKHPESVMDTPPRGRAGKTRR
jgi:hypothetical protein